MPTRLFGARRFCGALGRRPLRRFGAFSFALGLILAPLLNTIVIAGVPLGFWFAQQGSIYVFIALIFIYVVRMNKLDRKYDVHEE